MNKISPLDIRIAVLAYPLVVKEEKESISLSRPIAPYSGDERIISLFQNSPKAVIEPSPSKVPPLLRKGQFALIRLMEILKTWLQEKEQSNVLSDIAPPRTLLVPGLPHPPFQSHKPPRFFEHQDEYAPSCLISEAKEDLPATVYNSASICAYARCALPKKGTLRQDSDGFVYLELTDAFISDLVPLLNDEECEPIVAHIPVLLPQEWAQKKGLGEIAELEKEFPFEIIRLCSLKPKRWQKAEKVYFLSIKSPELEKFRERCLLPSRIRGHEFHIAIAYKKSTVLALEKETFRLNVSCFAA
jgi:hypothetical protein